MKIEIEISEERLTELVEAEIVRQILTNEKYQNRNAKMGVRDGIDKGVKQYIYSNKDEIIERVVDRASKEIVRKGIPRLLDEIK